MYDSKKVEPEGTYHIVTWTNIERTLWVTFEHSYMNLLLQIDCFLKSNEQIVLNYWKDYKHQLDKQHKRLTRFDAFMRENGIIRDIMNDNQNEEPNPYAAKAINFISMLKLKQHHKLTKHLNDIQPYPLTYTNQIQRQSSDQTQLSMQTHTSDTLTNVTDATTRHGGNVRGSTNLSAIGSTILMSPYSGYHRTDSRPMTSRSNTRNMSLMSTSRNRRVTSDASSAWM